MNSATQQNLLFKSIHLTALHNSDLLKEQLSFNDPEPFTAMDSLLFYSYKTGNGLPHQIQFHKYLRSPTTAKSRGDADMHKIIPDLKELFTQGYMC